MISTSRSFPIISSGLCFFAGIRRPFLGPDCNSRWTTQKGAAHLLSAVDIADRIGFLSNGRIEEERVAAAGETRFDLNALHARYAHPQVPA